MNAPLGICFPVPVQGQALLNLGCGASSHAAFVNVDLHATSGVIGYDLRRGIPFPDGSFDLVYHSTMLSMMRPVEALTLMRECCRVLKPRGVLRVVTEDLEQMCRVYLDKLEAACKGDRQSAADYEWMILELYDQATRERPGGAMADYLRQDPLLNEAFIYSRVGEQGRRIVAGARSRPVAMPVHSRPSTRHLLVSLKTRVRKLILTALLGPRGLQAWELGTFRLTSGGVSYRMYDRFSLGQLFVRAGLSDVEPRTPRESAYPLWNDVNLDVDPNGETARPHTLIMEGIRAS